MSSNELEVLLSPSGTIEFFAGKTERERKEFSVQAVNTLKAAIDHIVNNWSAPRNEQRLEAARLAVLATGTFTEIKKFALDGLAKPEHCLAVLMDRKPSWLDKWMEMVLQDAPYLYLPIIRTMEQAGLGQAPRNTAYFTGLLLNEVRRDPSGYFFSDHSPIEDVWSLLTDLETMKQFLSPTWEHFGGRWRSRGDQLHRSSELQGNQFHTACAVATPLKESLLRLSSEQVLEPERLRDTAFETLIRMTADGPADSPPAYMGMNDPVSWWTAIIDALSQGNEHALTNKYIGLLASKDPQVLSWSLEKLATFPVESIPLPDLYANIGTALSIKKKDPALHVLKLMQHVLKQRPAELETVAPLVASGLEHSSTEVQKRTIDFLEKTGAYKYSNTVNEMQYRSHSLKGLLKQRFDDLLRTSGAQPESDSQYTNYSPEDEETLIEKAFQLPPALADAAAIPEALDSLHSGSPISNGLMLNSMEIPRMRLENALTPLTDLDGLIYLAIRVVKRQATSDEVELVLDGLSRLCAIKVDDFESRVSALRKELNAIIRADDEWASQFFTPFDGQDHVQAITALLDSWIEGKVRKPNTGNGGMQLSELLLFFATRLHRMNSRIAQRRALPLLAAPTHKGGWIDARVLPGRLSEYITSGETPDLLDQVQCLLRIAPEFRADALGQLSEQQDEFHSALRFALGAKLEGPVVTAEVWAAAWRCREPRGTSKFLLEKFGCYGPDAFTAATYRDYPDAIKRSMSAYSHGALPELLKSFPPKIPHRSLHFPAVLLHEEIFNAWTGGLGPIDLIWPGLQESYLAFQTKILAQYITSTGTYWKGSWDLLFDPDVPTVANGAWLIALALCSKQKEAARLALDALICSVDDGRLDGQTFGTVFGKMAISENTSMTKWMQALSEVARISAMHGQFALDAIEACLPHLYLPHQDRPPSIPMLELFHELCTKYGETPKEEYTKTYLRAVPGTGKGAKIAKMLLAMTQTDKVNHHRREVILQILDIRIQRAERWQRLVEANRIQ